MGFSQYPSVVGDLPGGLTLINCVVRTSTRTPLPSTSYVAKTLIRTPLPILPNNDIDSDG